MHNKFVMGHQIVFQVLAIVILSPSITLLREDSASTLVDRQETMGILDVNFGDFFFWFYWKNICLRGFSSSYHYGSRHPRSVTEHLYIVHCSL